MWVGGDFTACAAFLTQKKIEYQVVRTFVTIAGRSPAARRYSSAPPRSNVPAEKKTKKPCTDKTGPRAKKEASQFTTVMVRNLPIRAAPDHVMEHLAELGFGDSYETLYLPVDSKSGMNRGYGFIHFDTWEMAAKFCEKVEGTQLCGRKKALTASIAAHQGALKKTQLKRAGKKVKTDLQFTPFAWVR